MFAGIVSICLSCAQGGPLCNVAPANNVMTHDDRRTGLVFGVDLHVGFMIIYRACINQLITRTKRRHTHGHKNEFHLEGIRCKACGCPESAQGREHQCCEHHGSSQRRSVAWCGAIHCSAGIPGPPCARRTRAVGCSRLLTNRSASELRTQNLLYLNYKRFYENYAR